MDLTEDQVEDAMASLSNSRTWKQNKDLKRAAKRDREYFGGRRGGDAPPPPRGPPGGRGGGARGRGGARG
eukprot:3919834-Pyramimonas_sp.AAC.1